MILEDKVEKIISESIRPVLKLHNGDIKLISIDEKNIKVKLLGSCSSCPSAQITIEEVVEQKMKEILKDEVEKVTLVNETRDDILEFAKKIMSRD